MEDERRSSVMRRFSVTKAEEFSNSAKLFDGFEPDSSATNNYFSLKNNLHSLVKRASDVILISGSQNGSQMNGASVTSAAVELANSNLPVSSNSLQPEQIGGEGDADSSALSSMRKISSSGRFTIHAIDGAGGVVPQQLSATLSTGDSLITGGLLTVADEQCDSGDDDAIVNPSIAVELINLEAVEATIGRPNNAKAQQFQQQISQRSVHFDICVEEDELCTPRTNDDDDVAVVEELSRNDKRNRYSKRHHHRTHHSKSGKMNHGDGHDSEGLIIANEEEMAIEMEVNDDGESYESSSNATINLKSWRHVETLEHPPIMDFYRNTADDESGGFAARPSMLELLHGGAHSSSPNSAFHNFKEEHENLVENQMAVADAAAAAAAANATVGGLGSSAAKLLLSDEALSAITSASAPVLTSKLNANLGGIAAAERGRLLYNANNLTALATQNGLPGKKSGSDIGGGTGGGSAVGQAPTVAAKTAGSSVGSGAKFGWVEGVFFRCILNIFGVMLYLRISWVSGQAGIALGSLIVLLASAVTTITALSTCAICTNGDVRGGGAYFLISRSLGPEFGGSIGLIFSVANAVGASMYIVGFAETVRDILRGHSIVLLDGGLNDVRIVGLVTCVCLISIVFIGTSFESKMQMGLLVILLASILDYIVGTFVPVTDEQLRRGITGYKFETLKENLLPSFRDGYNFFTVFSIYFPAATGIMAGANISGDLANPQVMESESLWGPLITAGIFAATLSSALASLVSAPKIFQAVCRDRLFPYINRFAKGSAVNDEPQRAYALAFLIAMVMILIGDLNAIAPIISNFFLCSYALINYACFDNSFAHSPGFRPAFRYYNMWISLLGAVLCVTVMFIVSWLTALLTFFFFACLFMYLSHRKPDVNWGSSTQAHSYRTALQGVTRLEYTDEHVKNYRPQVLVLTGNPATRPSLVDFVYNITKGTSLMICGCVIPYTPSDSVFAMMQTHREQIGRWLRKRHIKSFFGCVANADLRAGVQSLLQASGLGKLRPNILFVGFRHKWADGLTAMHAEAVEKLAAATGSDTDLNALYRQSENFSTQLETINEYFGMIQDAFDCNMGVAILRSAGSEGLDLSESMRFLSNPPQLTSNIISINATKSTVADCGIKSNKFTAAEMPPPNKFDSNEQSTSNGKQSSLNHSVPSSSSDFSKTAGHLPNAHSLDSMTVGLPTLKVDEVKAVSEAVVASSQNEAVLGGLLRSRGSSRRLTTVQRDLLLSVNRFQRRIKHGTIDVWWLYDDGGLTLLLPYLLTQEKSYLEHAKMRVFTISKSASGVEQEQRAMAALLSKFRIEFSDLHVIGDVARKPKSETIADFKKFVAPFRVTASETSGGNTELKGLITDAEWSAQNDKIMRQLRIAELLRQHSTEADLIVLSLPVPRKLYVSSCLYMAWLDFMTRNLPSTLLVRGNQNSVLTFYS